LRASAGTAIEIDMVKIEKTPKTTNNVGFCIWMLIEIQRIANYIGSINPLSKYSINKCA
jgi:hypothetical protein